MSERLAIAVATSAIIGATARGHGRERIDASTIASPIIVHDSAPGGPMRPGTMVHAGSPGAAEEKEAVDAEIDAAGVLEEHRAADRGDEHAEQPARSSYSRPTAAVPQAPPPSPQSPALG